MRLVFAEINPLAMGHLATDTLNHQVVCRSPGPWVSVMTGEGPSCSLQIETRSDNDKIPRPILACIGILISVCSSAV